MNYFDFTLSLSDLSVDHIQPKARGQGSHLTTQVNLQGEENMEEDGEKICRYALEK